MTLSEKIEEKLAKEMLHFSSEEKIKLAKQGEHLDILVKDKDWKVRKEVAKYGRYKDLDILVNDEDDTVREIVTQQRRDKDLDILVNDENLYVRLAVAEIGRDKDLDILVRDKEIYVLREVLEHKRPQDIKILKEKIDNNDIYNDNHQYDTFIQQLKEPINNLINKENQL